MANAIFNVALGRIRTYAELGAANDGIIVLLLVATGLEADGVIVDHDDVAALLAAANDEATFTNYARKTITSVTVTVDDTNNRLDLDVADQTWTAAGGALNNSLGAVVTAYDPDTTVGTDATLVPVSKHDFVVTTDASDLTAQIAAAGFARAQG